MIVDATDAIAGRLASFVAKQALHGEKVDVVNVEKAILTGGKAFLMEKFQHRRDRGTPTTGPFYPRNAHQVFKRMVKGMLPTKQTRGREAIRRVRCYMGVPESFQGKEAVKRDDVSQLQTRKYITLKELSKLLGAQ